MTYEFKFPDVGEGVHEGKILKLNYKNGDAVNAGDILAIVETDKVVAEIPSSKNGVLLKYGAEEGQVITVGSVLAYIEIEGEVEEKPKEMVEEAGAVVGELEGPGDTVLPVSGEGVSDTAPESVSLVEEKKKVLATPVARKLASDHDIDISTVKGSGPAGRVMRNDILHLIETKTELKPKPEKRQDIPLKPSHIDTQPSPTEGAQVFELSTVRKTIAANMEASQNIPAFVIQDFTAIDELAEFREKLKNEHGKRISFQPFFMKAVAAAAKKYPIVNATYDPQKKEVALHKEVNIGVAVNTDEGLMVPVIKNVASKSIEEIQDELSALVESAKNRSITLEDLREGTISITNFGAFGGVYGRPMILPPQVVILGFGRIHEAPIVKNGVVVPKLILPVSMTCDHRVVDGVPGASFLTHFLQLLGDMQNFLVAI